jgi:NADPH-dependent glutamate synthase beta subunit-like oxidoreductase
MHSIIAPSSGRKVAVIGAGPAGLTAAFYLAKAGHKATIFEALPEPGGMMRVGIPEYRLPRNILKEEIITIQDHGVEIKLNQKVDSLDGLFKDGYQAVLIALGAHRGSKMRVPGEDITGVMDGAFFLREISLGRKVQLGKKVAVIGGGNSAVDSARVALRTGADEVTMLYRRTRAEMPAAVEEIQEALDEGIHIDFLVAPNKLSRTENGVSLECLRMRLGKPDASGRRQPEPVSGSEFSVVYDAVIASIGQTPEIPIGISVKLARGNTISVNEDTLETSIKGVFAAGDAVTGPASVIEAIAAGRKAASNIDKFLGGTGYVDEVLTPPDDRDGWIGQREGLAYQERHQGELMKPEMRVCGFQEARSALSEEDSAYEGRRCLRCDLRLKLPAVELPPDNH